MQKRTTPGMPAAFLLKADIRIAADDPGDIAVDGPAGQRQQNRSAQQPGQQAVFLLQEKENT